MLFSWPRLSREPEGLKLTFGEPGVPKRTYIFTTRRPPAEGSEVSCVAGYKAGCAMRNMSGPHTTLNKASVTCCCDELLLLYQRHRSGPLWALV